MPELPEVELTMRHLLNCNIVGKSITDAYFYRHTTSNRRHSRGSKKSPFSSRLFDVLSNQSYTARIRATICNRTITAVERVGKYLLCSVGTSELMLHLGMSGKLFMHSKQQPIAQARSIARARKLSGRSDIRIILRFADGDCLTFCDARMFGSIAVYASATEITERIGVDALHETLSPQLIITATRGHRCSIKTLLLSQRPIAGLGNIYCDEVLWLAMVHPEQPVCDIEKHRIDTLLSAIGTVLNDAISNGGTNLQDGVHGFESPYIASTNQLHIKVYGRDGQQCKRCGDTIIKYQYHQRGTHYCPSCQVLSTAH